MTGPWTRLTLGLEEKRFARVYFDRRTINSVSISGVCTASLRSCEAFYWEEMESVVDKSTMLRFCMPLFCWQYIYILICKICKA